MKYFAFEKLYLVPSLSSFDDLIFKNPLFQKKNCPLARFNENYIFCLKIIPLINSVQLFELLLILLVLYAAEKYREISLIMFVELTLD